MCIQFELDMNSDYCCKSKSTWNNHSAFPVSNNILQIPSSRSNGIMGMSSISPSFQNPPPSTGGTLWAFRRGGKRSPQSPKQKQIKVTLIQGGFFPGGWLCIIAQSYKSFTEVPALLPLTWCDSFITKMPKDAHLSCMRVYIQRCPFSFEHFWVLFLTTSI